MKHWLVELCGGKNTQQRGMEEAAENGKESSYFARVSEWMNERVNVDKYWKISGLLS